VRKLIAIANADYVRNLVEAGAFDAIDDEETWYTSGPLSNAKQLEARGNYIGPVEVGTARRDAYSDIRKLLLAAYRFRSRTARIKLNTQDAARRRATKIRALPGLRHRIIRKHLEATGPNEQLREVIEKVDPDLIIAPSGGTDPFVMDLLRTAHELGRKTLIVIYNWDNLSSKSAFLWEPDYLGVVGRQSVDHAWRIHRIPAERVQMLGGPYIDHYFRHELGSTKSPFPFRYALFAGCYLQFDELTALQRLEQAIEEQGLDLKVVYRPHPHRRRRSRPDFVDESKFKHVVIDPQVRDAYLDAHRDDLDGAEAPQALPALDYYPALLENAEFVVCPLSTMMIEAAIFERRVLAIAYHDGIHRSSPGVAVDYMHFEGIDEVDGFTVVRDLEQLAPRFTELANGGGRPKGSIRDQVDRWVYWDERTYAERLAAYVDEIARREQIPQRVRSGSAA
jgi:hypothetical protein